MKTIIKKQLKYFMFLRLENCALVSNYQTYFSNFFILKNKNIVLKQLQNIPSTILFKSVLIEILQTK